MILKMLDCEDMKHEKSVKDSWTYLDNITSARVTYDEDVKETVISCTFKGSDDVIAITVKYLGILMSDTGCIIDRIYCKAINDQSEDTGTTLQEAVEKARTEYQV